jgi:CBS domain-containing protein
MDISDDDVLEAMKTISGFLDITPGDFREIYIHAYRHSVERLRKSVKASQIMTSTVVSVQDETSLLETAELLAEKNISGLPVVNTTMNVIGVISEKDFLYAIGGGQIQSFMGVIIQCMKNKGCMAVSFSGKTAADIMTTPPITVKPETSLYELADIFEKRKINRVPVVDSDSRLVGIVTRSDIVQSFCMRNF